MADPLVETWQIHDRINRYLLNAVPDEALGKAMARQDRRPGCFIQVDIGNEPQKGGCAIADLPALIVQAREADVPLLGLMAIPPAEVEAAPYFALLAKLAREHGLDGLSMGMSGDYPTAEQGFRDHISRFPKDAKAADAHYWLGESLLGQQKYRDAAEIFLAASKDYPKAKKAPDMMLKLGVSLVGLKQRDVACATFGEIGKRYPNASGTLKERVKQERALASC